MFAQIAALRRLLFYEKPSSQSPLLYYKKNNLVMELDPRVQTAGRAAALG